MKRLIVLLLCVVTTACVPLPIRKVKGVSGSGKSEDYSFVKEGQTTRDEVVRKLGWADAGIKEDRLFWGRWSSSKWVWVGGGPQLGVGAIRPWSTHNLLIEFDEQGVVVRSHAVEEGSIDGELLAWWKRSAGTPVERSSFASMKVGIVRPDGQAADATLRFRGNSLELREAGSSNRISIAEILNIGGLQQEGGEPALLTQSVFYREGLDNPERITLRIDPSSLFTLLKYAASADHYIPVPSMPAPVPIAPADGTVFNTFPRTTTLRWNPSRGAILYIVQWDYSSNGVWAGDAHDFPDYHLTVPGTTYTFTFVGAQPGRWRVWPVSADALRGTPSEWRTFRYSR